MVNYQLGKIYKIVDNTNGNIYIGSTCEPTLARRLSSHIHDYKRKDARKSNISSFQIFDNNNYCIILIENYPCDNRDQLHARERYYIETIKCVNKLIPARTNQERKEYRKQYINDNKEKLTELKKIYYNNNKEKITEYRKQYWNDNKDNINEKRNIVLKCPCGGKYSKRDQARHERSKLHQNFINNSSLQP